MAYAKGGFPIEQASKIGHLKMVSDPTIKQIVESFESTEPGAAKKLFTKTGNISVSDGTSIERVIAIDGGQAIVPHPFRREKAIAFVQVVACMLKMDDLRYMRDHPMMDPRDLARKTEDSIWYNPAMIPLSGVRLPGRTVQETIRLLLHGTLTETRLYETLKYLVYREWMPQWPDEIDMPAMDCLYCGTRVELPRHALKFSCDNCSHEHWLSDYLSIGGDGPDHWAKEDAANALRDILETLSLFHFLRLYHEEETVIKETLFVKDGPLLLRAALSRLVEPIRAFICHTKENFYGVNLLGVEKTGDLVNFMQECADELSAPGDFFLPTVKFLLEEVAGVTMPFGYRNRVSYGAKILVRIGPDHILALNIPTGDFLTDPTLQDLIGFEDSVRALSELVSYRFENAIIPLVLANASASIARRPSGEILTTYADQFLGKS